jgi:sarcosine oxidase subunit gamma
MGSHAAKPAAARVVDLSFLDCLPRRTRLSFRGGPAAVAAAARVFGVELPTLACRSATHGSRSALWLGPDEYLLLAPEAERESLIKAFADDLGDIPHSVVDITHRQNALKIHGPNAAWILESGCPLDLDLSRFPVGMCTRTLYEKSEIVLWRTATDTFEIEVWRSFTEYVTSLIAQMAHELPG